MAHLLMCITHTTPGAWLRDRDICGGNLGQSFVLRASDVGLPMSRLGRVFEIGVVAERSQCGWQRLARIVPDALCILPMRETSLLS